MKFSELEVEKEIAVAARAWLARWDIRVREEFLLDLLRAQRLAGRKDRDGEVEGWKNQAHDIALSNADHVGWYREISAERDALRAQVETLTREVARLKANRGPGNLAEVVDVQQDDIARLTRERDDARARIAELEDALRKIGELMATFGAVDK